MTLPPLPALVREIENCITASHLDAALALCSNLRAAIAAVPAQPVAWIDKHGNIDRGLDAILSTDGWTPLYSIPHAEIERLRADRDCEKRMRKDSDDLATDLRLALEAVIADPADTGLAWAVLQRTHGA